MDPIVEGVITWAITGLIIGLIVAFATRTRDTESRVITIVTAVAGAMVGAAVLGPLVGIGSEMAIGYDPIRPGFGMGTEIFAILGALVVHQLVRRASR